MQPDQNIHQLIIRLFAGEASDEEKSTIEAWLNRHPENKKLYHELKEIWLSSGIEHNPDRYDVEKAIRQFRQKTRFLTEKTSWRQQGYRLTRYAAILLLAAALPFSYYYGKKSNSSSDSFTTITCALGDKTSIVLPDSSRVFLNSGSKLTFSNNFKNGSRRVSLDGEAYFSVRKDPRNPFRVKTSALDVEVLGTEFNLKAYSCEQTITTTLVTGSLKVTDNHRSIVIKPNQKLVFSKENQKMNLQEIADISPETDWKNGRLVFRNQSLGELEHNLERWFDVEIEFADEQVKSRRFTGTLERESILEVISYFGRSKYVAYNIKDNVITFYTEH
ncbi:MAG: FecR domain-containing protein [Bacteroidota bacterium]|nr:FecR domain-containing protein [Bacteroidota bacterium]